MNSVELLLVDLVQVAETPLYSAYRWLAKRLGRELPLSEFLRMIEWGMYPTYELTHQPTSDLIRSGFNRLFSAEYKDWVDVAANEYKLMREEFGSLNGQFIMAHDIVAYRVHRTTFEDGSQLIVN
jgi:hypothetical protein